MSRCRPTRPLILIALLLLAGAVMNVAIAWALVGAPDSWTPGGPAPVFSHEPVGVDPEPTEAEGDLLRQYLWAPCSWGRAFWAQRDQGRGWTATHVFAGGSASQVKWSGSRVDGGWPARSMAWARYTRYENGQEPEELFSFSMPPRPALLQDSGWFVYPRHRIPMRPVFPGFAINTLFYAAVVGATLAPPLLSISHIRRHLRTRRGRCPKCGYDLAGLRALPGGPPLRGGDGPAPTAPCPECGARRAAPPPQAEGHDRK